MISMAAVVATAYARELENSQCNERTRQLEESARRLRENAERLRTENRRGRTTGAAADPVANGSTNMCLRVATCNKMSSTEAEQNSVDCEGSATLPVQPTVSSRRHDELERMRRKIAELDEINELERRRLESEQRQAEERRRIQEEFERGVQEQTERSIREHQEREAQEAELHALREDEARREREERERQRREQLQQEEERSRRREELRREGRSEATQLKWQLFEEELEKTWAEQEAAERRHLNDYAKERRRQYDEWDRKLIHERHRFAPEAEFCDTARFHQKVRGAAHADEQFYSSRRAAANGPTPAYGKPPPSSRPHPKQTPRPPPHTGCGANAGVTGGSAQDLKGLTPEECGVLKELQSVRGASRDVQKAKVKDLFFRWHPDKNPSCTEKATRIFQFVQRQRELVLGL